jgi:enterochelin esterase-like enzyme
MAIADKYLNDTAYSGGLPIVEDRRVIFVFLDDAPRTRSLTVAGDFNDWNASSDPMIAAVSGFPFYYRVVSTDGGDLSGVRYKFVRNGREWLADPEARRFEHDDFGEISFVASPADRAHLERWPDFGVGAAVAERTLEVFVPAGEGPFPVIYAQDGQNLWPGGWRADQAANAAIAEGVPPFLIVAVPNSPARFDEYTQVEDEVGGLTGGGADLYVDFLVDAVKPFIDSRYATLPAREHTAVLGSSLGGLVSLYAAWLRPDVFGAAASFSGTVGWGSIALEGETIVDLYRDAPPDTFLYVDSGGSGGTTGCRDSDGDGLHDDGNGRDNYCENLDLLEVVRAAELDVVYRWVEGQPHNEASWASRLPGALRDWFPGAR